VRKSRNRADLALKRYKYVVQVTLGEVKKQGVRIASRCLWDTNNDNHSSYSFKNVSSNALPAFHAWPHDMTVCRSPCGVLRCSLRATLNKYCAFDIGGILKCCASLYSNELWAVRSSNHD